MECDQRRRSWHWLTGFAVPAVVAALVLPSPTQSQTSDEPEPPCRPVRVGALRHLFGAAQLL